ncbi:MAG: patatin-like phospholipase family protein, partial [Gammaproteobacteria bacterium]|nr:patatin-like phospholipase family protein [Gammaproteobacteria bacterium]
MTQASTLSIRVGATAAARLRAQGMHPDLFSVMVGASGGPKWFILSGMDSYLAGEFLPRRTSPMDLLGSSVGGWRMTAHACPDPVAALDHFRDHYHHLRYPEKATPSVISQSSRAMIASFVGGDTASAVCTHSRYRLHIVTAACRGLMASESRSAQLPGLALAAGANALSRRWLAGFFHRSLFHVPHSQAPFLGLSDLPTEQVALTERNLAAVLEATGAIPLVLEGVKGIEGSQHAVHRDGGIIDYHFDIPFANA